MRHVSFTHHSINDQNLILTSEKTIFWEEEKALIISDLHLCKSGHFRKSGIGIPQSVFKEDMHRLASQVQYFKPGQLLIVGDLFHSAENKEHELFLRWRADFSGLGISLIKGNHDILSDRWYEQAGIDVFSTLSIKPFSFVHDLSDCLEAQTYYCFSGHIHPGITISGAGRQSLRFPCFYFSQEFAVLPSFGKFTGSISVDPKRGDNIFAIVGDSVMQVHGQPAPGSPH